MEKYKKLGKNIKERIKIELESNGFYLNLNKNFYVINKKFNGWENIALQLEEKFETDGSYAAISTEEKDIVLYCLDYAWDEAIFDNCEELFQYLLDDR